jgi:hypothetical protein
VILATSRAFIRDIVPAMSDRLTHSQLKKLKVADLKNLLSSFSLRVTGKKDELIARILEHYEENQDEDTTIEGATDEHVDQPHEDESDEEEGMETDKEKRDVKPAVAVMETDHSDVTNNASQEVEAGNLEVKKHQATEYKQPEEKELEQIEGEQQLQMSVEEQRALRGVKEQEQTKTKQTDNELVESVADSQPGMTDMRPPGNLEVGVGQTSMAQPSDQVEMHKDAPTKIKETEVTRSEAQDLSHTHHPEPSLPRMEEGPVPMNTDAQQPPLQKPVAIIPKGQEEPLRQPVSTAAQNPPIVQESGHRNEPEGSQSVAPRQPEVQIQQPMGMGPAIKPVASQPVTTPPLLQENAPRHHQPPQRVASPTKTIGIGRQNVQQFANRSTNIAPTTQIAFSSGHQKDQAVSSNVLFAVLLKTVFVCK